MAEIDKNSLKETAIRLSNTTKEYAKRYFVEGIEIKKEPRIKILRGFRGVGKTTALLQMLSGQAFYFSMDNPQVERFSLYELGKNLVLSGNDVLLIDEIHHYKNWKRDTKALYDEFTNLSIVASGSAPLAFEPERRYEIWDIEPLSLKEFLELGGKKIQRNDTWINPEASLKFVAENSWLYEFYDQYLNGGGFPAYFSYKEKTLPSIYHSIKKSIREDAVLLANADGEMVMAMERTIIFLATSKLGEFSINSLSSVVEINKNKAYQMVALLESMKILRLVRPYGRGSKLVRGEPKLMFYHPNLRKAICNALNMQVDIGAQREEMAVFALLSRGWSVNTIKGMKKSPDYIIEKGKERIIIEIGGPSKGKGQLRGFEEKTLVLDDRSLIVLGLF